MDQLTFGILNQESTSVYKLAPAAQKSIRVGTGLVCSESDYISRINPADTLEDISVWALLATLEANGWQHQWFSDGPKPDPYDPDVPVLTWYTRRHRSHPSKSSLSRLYLLSLAKGKFTHHFSSRAAYMKLLGIEAPPKDWPAQIFQHSVICAKSRLNHSQEQVFPKDNKQNLY